MISWHNYDFLAQRVTKLIDVILPLLQDALGHFQKLQVE